MTPVGLFVSIMSALLICLWAGQDRANLLFLAIVAASTIATLAAVVVIT